MCAGVAIAAHIVRALAFPSVVAARDATSTISGPPVTPTCAAPTPRQREPKPSGQVAVSVPAGNEPFGVAVAADGAWAFVSHPDGSVGVFSLRSRRPRLLHTLATPLRGAAGITLTHNGHYLLVAAGNGLGILDVQRLEGGTKGALLRTLHVQGPIAAAPLAASAIEVTASEDDQLAFVSLEFADRIAVFNLQAALLRHGSSPAYLGSIEPGRGVVGQALSPDGLYLYVTSELARQTAQHGTLSVIDVARAAHNPANAVIATVAAGCTPVRVAVSPNGKTVWVTARGNDALLAFQVAALLRSPSRALRAIVPTGAAPVGVAFTAGGRRIVVCDSNRFGSSGSGSDVRVIDPALALQRRRPSTGVVATGRFPREIVAVPRTTRMLLTAFGSGQLQMVTVAHG